MKRLIVFILGVLWLAPVPLFAADSCRLAYGWKPGQTWKGEVMNIYDSSAQGREANQKNRSQITYRISKGDRAGWVHVKARIRNRQMQGGMDISRVLYEAEVHSSGQLRNVHYTGSLMPEEQARQMQQMPEQMQAMMRKSYDMTAEMMKQAVFWFPELPEDELQIGDEFEVIRKSGASMPGMMQMQSVTKQVYVLEDIDNGLAYFSVRDRSVVRYKGMGSGTTRIGGKSDAVFDLKQGMWVEINSRSKVSGNYSMGGGGSDGSSAGVTLTRYVMELQ